MTMLALAGTASAAPAYDSAFRHYQPFREPVVRLAGRDTVKPATKPADPHAGHAMHDAAPAAKLDPHAGHAGHQPAAKKPKPPPQPTEGHEHHDH